MVPPTRGSSTLRTLNQRTCVNVQTPQLQPMHWSGDLPATQVYHGVHMAHVLRTAPARTINRSRTINRVRGSRFHAQDSRALRNMQHPHPQHSGDANLTADATKASSAATPD